MKVLRTAGVTDTGRKRRRNEDAYVLSPPIFAVADGMGGAQAGELASRLTAAALKEQGEPSSGSGEERVVTLIQEANRRVYERSSEDPAVSGMGTTVTVALVEDGAVTIGHVGDSRAYLLRGGSFEQLTEDHSLVAELMRDGKLSPEEAEVHPQRSVITRALGTDPDVDVDSFRIEARAGDLFLLCSDGLTTMVDDETIAQIVEDHREDLEAAARTLIATANRGGGEDNITVVVFELAEETTPEDATARLPALDDGTAAPDEEDTLDELDDVPAVDTAVVPPEQAAELLEETSSQERRRRPLLPLLLLVLLVLLIAALVAWGVVEFG